ncbi:hypothetical protein VN12_16470 [Pirellula sp. SH-Sr6A]|nr:hypothetical protein VN12_16470 [Pirellula sp. SH-Sr6A]
MGQRFVRPELQLLLVLYGFHFAVWVPIAHRIAPPELFAQVLLALTPIAICLALSLLWVCIGDVARLGTWEDSPWDRWMRVLLVYHGCLIGLTLFFLAIKATGYC